MPDSIPIRRVSGFCFDDSGRVLLREMTDRCELPGCAPDPAVGDADKALMRGCREQWRISITEPIYLGYQRVDERNGTPPYAELRMAAHVTAFHPLDADASTSPRYRRLLSPISNVPAVLHWGVEGLLQATAAAIAAMDLLQLDLSGNHDEAYRD
ncbi:hypothetical protein [Streptomyces sp. UNOC14_S4]|uniref:hypothetical protein n=1 Tax=Streptomyces sp. UNOC14_S4 TaxID=2872340 RepID=UPI001E28ED3F|nr:hypothetical protein [Streptomyces sp. UNOC14_S4]